MTEASAVANGIDVVQPTYAMADGKKLTQAQLDELVTTTQATYRANPGTKRVRVAPCPTLAGVVLIRSLALSEYERMQEMTDRDGRSTAIRWVCEVGVIPQGVVADLLEEWPGVMPIISDAVLTLTGVERVSLQKK